MPGGYTYIDYLGGSATGPAVQDVFTLDGLECNQTFVAADSPSWGNIPVDRLVCPAFGTLP